MYISFNPNRERIRKEVLKKTMTKEERFLEKLAIEVAKSVDCQVDKYVDLDDCYTRYSSYKSRAYWDDVEKFNEVILTLGKHSNCVTSRRSILSHNCMMFTLFQIAYCTIDDILYVAYRYDTRRKTIERYLIISKYQTIVHFETLGELVRLSLDKINK